MFFTCLRENRHWNIFTNVWKLCFYSLISTVCSVFCSHWTCMFSPCCHLDSLDLVLDGGGLTAGLRADRAALSSRTGEKHLWTWLNEWMCSFPGSHKCTERRWFLTGWFMWRVRREADSPSDMNQWLTETGSYTHNRFYREILQRNADTDTDTVYWKKVSLHPSSLRRLARVRTRTRCWSHISVTVLAL